MGVHPGRYNGHLMCASRHHTDAIYGCSSHTCECHAKLFTFDGGFREVKKIKSLLSYHTSYIERSQFTNEILPFPCLGNLIYFARATWIETLKAPSPTDTMYATYLQKRHCKLQFEYLWHKTQTDLKRSDK